MKLNRVEKALSGEEVVAQLERQRIMVDRAFVYRFRGDFILGVGRRW